MIEKLKNRPKEFMVIGLGVLALAGCGDSKPNTPAIVEHDTPQYQIKEYKFGKTICYVAYHEYNNGYTSSMAMDCTK